jgi:alpha-tubulin suppressor-like RCC1 family protein
MARRLKRNTVDYLPLSKYPITSAAVANDKAILVLNHGETIIVTGENICGELGVGGVTKDTYNKATVDLEKVHFNDRVDCVALGQTQGLFTTASGDCYTTGRDCKLIRETLLTLTVDGLYCGESMFDSRKPFLLSGLRKVIKYAQSSEARKKYHVLALTEAGDLYAWGSNYLSKVTPSLYVM